MLFLQTFRLSTVSRSWTTSATEMGSIDGFSWADRQLHQLQGHEKVMRLTRKLVERMRRGWTPEFQLYWGAAGRKTTQGLRKTEKVS